eukprot:6211840-Pleurochrysis_carterae.AAC.1
MAARPCMNTHPEIGCRVAQSESECPCTRCAGHSSYRRPTCRWWYKQARTRRAAASRAEAASGSSLLSQHPDGVCDVRPASPAEVALRLCCQDGFDELWQIVCSRRKSPLRSRWYTVGHEGVDKMSDVR